MGEDVVEREIGMKLRQISMNQRQVFEPETSR